MYNIIKVHPQDRVRREGSFNQFSVDLPGVRAEDRERERSLETSPKQTPRASPRPSPRISPSASQAGPPSPLDASPMPTQLNVGQEQPGCLNAHYGQPHGQPQYLQQQQQPHYPQQQYMPLPQLAKLLIPQPEQTAHEPLRPMEPSMQISPDVPSHLPAFTRSRSHLSPMHAALPPLQTRFSSGSIQPSPVSPSPLTTCSPPISPVYAGNGGYYSYPNTPISPIHRQ